MKKVAVVPVFVLIASALSGCLEDKDYGTSGDAFDFNTMFVNLAENIIVPGYQQAAASTQSLSSETGPIATYCDAIASADEATALSSAQTAWRSAMDDWQFTEISLIGPVTENESALRNRILSYYLSSVNSCGVDQAVLLSQDAEFDLQSRSSNQRGLGAIEYLLFNDNLEHSCPSQITETANWNERPESERKLMRCQYARQLAIDVSSATTAVYDAWRSDSGNYSSTFTDPENATESLDALTEGLFFVDTEVKDAKLAIPLSISDGCSQAACPDSVESPYSKSSLQNIRSNMMGFIALFTGESGLSFDDIIVNADFEQVAVEMTEKAQTVIDTIDVLMAADTNLKDFSESQLASGSEDVCTNSAANPDNPATPNPCHVYGQVKLLTDQLKTDFVTIVNIELPQRVESDND